MRNYLVLNNVPEVIRDLYNIATSDNGKSYDTLLKVALGYEDDGTIYGVSDAIYGMSDDGENEYAIVVTYEDEEKDLFHYVFGYDSKGYLEVVYVY